MGRYGRRLAAAFTGFTGHPPGQRILDVGCGTGSLALALAERGDHAAIAGIDPAEPYIAYARGPAGRGWPASSPRGAPPSRPRFAMSS